MSRSSELFSADVKSAKIEILELEKFDYSKYYEINMDTSIKKRYVQLKRDGSNNECMSLLADYYKNKFGTNIIPHNHKPFQDQIHEFISSADFSAIRNSKGDYRVAFIGGESLHSVPIVYIKEGDKEAFLVSCSKGKQSPADLLSEKTGITCYYVSDFRQADLYSCHSDAVVFAKDATAFDSDNQKYAIPDLLARLDARSVEDKKNPLLREVKLVDELLKTPQLSKFVNDHAEVNSTVIIHKDDKHAETRKQFSDRYTVGGKNTYIYIKAIKLASILEIQFYANQLEKKLGNLWTKELHNQFIKDAKNEVKKLGPLITGREMMWDVGPSRKTLHDFTKQFILKILPDLKIEDAKPKKSRNSWEI